MKRLLSAPAMIVALWIAPATAGAHPFIVDQQNDGFVPPLFQSIQVLGPIGQEFTPTLASLDVVELFTADLASNNGIGASLQLNIRALTIFGAIVGTSFVVPHPDAFFGVTHFDFPAPVPLVPGIFVMEIIVVGGDSWGVGSSGGPVSTYPGGDQIIQGVNFPDNDLWFREGPAAAPEPFALLLLASGLVALGVVARRRQFRDHHQ